jgi:glycosyltransferase involved in cell wall biosynthesis
MGRPVVATRCIGSEDYILHERTGFLVAPHDVDELRMAIQRLWDDRVLREKLGKNAAEWSAENCSDEAIGAILGRILDEVEATSS